MAKKHFNVTTANALAIAIAFVFPYAVHSAAAQGLEAPASEQLVKDSIHRVAKSAICFDNRLLNAAGIDRGQCEFGILLFASDCWEILDRWVSDYELGSTPEDKAKYERIADFYMICQESRFLKSRILKPNENGPGQHQKPKNP